MTLQTTRIGINAPEIVNTPPPVLNGSSNPLFSCQRIGNYSLQPVLTCEDLAKVVRAEEKSIKYSTAGPTVELHSLQLNSQEQAKSRREGGTGSETQTSSTNSRVKSRQPPRTQKDKISNEIDPNLRGRQQNSLTFSRCSFLRSGQSMPIHMLHPHPHRRHYPHHLLDHFTGDHQITTSATWSEVIPTAEPPTGDRQIGEPGGLQEPTEVTARGRERSDDNAAGRETRDSNNNPTPVYEEQRTEAKTYSELQDPKAWPFFGTETRVLPSGRRVSFLRQACLGFSSLNTPKRDEGMETICPKAYREATFSGTPRRTFLRSNSGTKVAELRRRFTDIANNAMKPPEGMTYTNLNKFRNETVKGPHEDLPTGSSLQEGSKTRPEVSTGPVILDSSSTKGNHPVPRAPGLRSPGVSKHAANTCPAAQRNKNRISKISTPPSPSTKPDRDRATQARSPVKSTSPSPTRRKQSPSTGTTPKGHAAPQQAKGRSVSPKSKPVQEIVASKSTKPFAMIPAANKRDNTNKKKGTTKVIQSARGDKPVRDLLPSKGETTPSSSESLCEGSSLVMVDADEMENDDVTSTYEDLSNDVSAISDRNFLVDYGDPSRFYFRNEWDARMRGIDEITMTMKEKLMRFCKDQEVLQGTTEIIDEVENVKQEMEELYDYFDHFEREEDTLLQQVQRQLVQANRYCKILQYRLERAEQHRTDDKKVKELEEELKLSRQVAVSLHWELQTADTKQAKLESENMNMRHRLLAVETANQALTAKSEKLQNDVDQMSLHAPSQVFHVPKEDNSNGALSTDTLSDIKRQLQFIEEKEEIMLSRLVDLQKEKDSLKDELDQYREQYGELASNVPSGTGRHTDLKLRLKLAEDQAGLLARKVIDLQLENDNMIKLAAEKELMAKEVIERNPSVSDLQFLEDERESLRLALDEMEIENQKLAAELLRYKQAVHRQLHSNSSSTESPLDVGVMIRVPRSNDSVFDEESKISARSHKTEDKSTSHHETISDLSKADRKKLRPLSLTSPLNQTQKKTKMSISRTLSDIAIPLSPDTKSQALQVTSTPTTISSITAPGNKSLPSNGSRKSNTKSKRSRKAKMVDVAVETDREVKKTPVETKNQTVECMFRRKNSTKTQATSPIITNLQNIFQPALDFVTQIRERKMASKSAATSPIAIDPVPNLPTPTRLTGMTSPMTSSNHTSSSHNVLLDEMRRQIACVRNIAESMDTVVDVEEMEAELERKGKAIVQEECRRIKEKSEKKRKLAKMAKSLQKHIKDMENSVTAVEGEATNTFDGALAEVTGWNLHGNAELTPKPDSSITETLTLTLPSSSSEDLVSMDTVRSVTTAIRKKTISEISLRALEGTVLVIIVYVLLSSLPASALLQICFLLAVFFIC